MNATKPTVPLVDDDAVLLDTLSAALEDDFTVTTADCGDRALELLETDEFLVVCSDFQMPGMNGIELLRRVAELPVCTCGILMTGHIEMLARPEWLEGRAVGVLFKPCDPGELIENLRQLADLARMRRRVRPSPSRKP